MFIISSFYTPISAYFYPKFVTSAPRQILSRYKNESIFKTMAIRFKVIWV